MITKDQVTKLYIAMFQRAPSESEVDYWYNTAEQNNLDTIGLANTMLQAAKDATHMFGLENLYPQYANYDPNNPDSIKNIVDTVYQTLFNKDAAIDPEGVQYWTNEVVENGKSLGEVVVAMEKAAEDIAAHPEKYEDKFDPQTLEEAVNAAKAFEAKVEAAKEIATEIKNVKTDSQSLEELKNVIKQIHSHNDIEKIKNEVDILKEKVEDLSHMINHDNNHGDYDDNVDYNDYDNNNDSDNDYMMNQYNNHDDNDDDMMKHSKGHNYNDNVEKTLSNQSDATDTTDTALSQEEINDLIFMREEEKLARDVYLTLSEKYNLPVFENIAQAEQTHMDAIKGLLGKYNIEDPIKTDEIGVFSNSELQNLYNQLVSEGSKSEIDALNVGLSIENKDIQDLENAMNDTDNFDILTVYSNLEKGSENHEEAFSYWLGQETSSEDNDNIVSNDQINEDSNYDLVS